MRRAAEIIGRGSLERGVVCSSFWEEAGLLWGNMKAAQHHEGAPEDLSLKGRWVTLAASSPLPLTPASGITRLSELKPASPR